GSEDVLLPPHLTQIGAGDRTPALVRGLYLCEQDAPVAVLHDAVGCGEVAVLGLSAKERGGGPDAVGGSDPGGDLRLTTSAMVGVGVAAEACPAAELGLGGPRDRLV